MNNRSYQGGSFSYFNGLDGLYLSKLCRMSSLFSQETPQSRIQSTKTQEDTLKLCFLSLNIPHWRFNS